MEQTIVMYFPSHDELFQIEILFRHRTRLTFLPVGNVSKVLFSSFGLQDTIKFVYLDEEGVYYWHKRTGTVTRERPELIIDSPSSTLSTSSSNDICFETNSLLSNSESSPSIKVLINASIWSKMNVI